MSDISDNLAGYLELLECVESLLVVLDRHPTWHPVEDIDAIRAARAIVAYHRPPVIEPNPFRHQKGRNA